MGSAKLVWADHMIAFLGLSGAMSMNEPDSAWLFAASFSI
jgi:hypothetical protein